MEFPHSPNFRNVPAIVFWFATLVGLVAMFVPGDIGALRWFSIAVAYFMVGAGFGTGWIFAHMIRLMFGWLSPSFAFKVAVLYFYGFVACVLLMPFAIVLDSALRGQELYELLVSLPAAAGGCAGIRQVLIKHAIAV